MNIKVQSSTVICRGDPAADPTEVPLTIFDRFATNIHIAIIYAFTPPTSSNAAIIDGLLKSLVHFPTLTSRLAKGRCGRPCVIMGGDGGGALLMEATVDSKLSDHLPLVPSPVFKLLHPPDEDPVHLLQVQLNRFSCGGLVIGISAHHRVADGQSMSSFFVAWSKTVRGAPIDPLPSYDCSWIKPRQPPRIEFDHWDSDFAIDAPQDEFENPINLIDPTPEKITNIVLRFSSEYIATKLKAQLPEKYTTFQTLLGHLWRKITIARGLGDEQETMMRVSVNCRPRLRPPVPSEFFGNLVLNTYPTTTAKALNDEGLAGAARLIHEAVHGINDDYIKSFIDFGEVYAKENLVPCYDVDGAILSPNMEVDSWLGFRFQEVHFGGDGELCAFLPTWVPFEGLMMFIPTLHGEGGVDVFVTLLEEHARALSDISHSVD